MQQFTPETIAARLKKIEELSLTSHKFHDIKVLEEEVVAFLNHADRLLQSHLRHPDSQGGVYLDRWRIERLRYSFYRRFTEQNKEKIDATQPGSTDGSTGDGQPVRSVADQTGSRPANDQAAGTTAESPSSGSVEQERTGDADQPKEKGATRSESPTKEKTPPAAAEPSIQPDAGKGKEVA